MVVGSSGDGLVALELFVAVHVFLITVVELWLLKRYDFATMFAFRLLYYLYWHIGWGVCAAGPRHLRAGALSSIPARE